MADGLLVGDFRVQGVRLNSLGYNIDFQVGASQISARDLVGVGGPNMDGVNPSHHGRYTSPPQFRLSMWVAGNSRAQFESNWETVVSAFVSRDPMITVERCMGDDTIRTAKCRVAGTVIPDENRPGGTHDARFEVVLDIPGIFWYGPEQTSPWMTAFGSATAVQFLQPGTAPVTDGVFEIRGPITSPRIENGDGGYVQLNRNLASGETWTIDAKNFRSRVGSTSVLAQTDYSGSSGYLFETWKPYRFTVTGGGRDTNTAWRVTARPKFF